MAEEYGKCLANVKSFVDQYGLSAQKLAEMLGNDVTAAEVLAVSGNETSYGTSLISSFGNFFGLHGDGPEGTYYTTENKTPVMKFKVQSGFMDSGKVFVNHVKPYMTAGIGKDPLKFFAVLNQHGYATGNSGYPKMMVDANPKRRGPYILIMACLAGR